MERCSKSLALALGLLASILAGPALAQAAPPLTGFTMATWNIAKLSTDGRVMFGDGLPRQDADYGNLRRVRDAVDADIYALQEISSPAALARVFDTTAFELCISGQWQADALDLGPNYAAAKLRKNQIRPKCYAIGEAMPDTAGDDSKLKQYVAIAVRRSSGIRIVGPQDIPTLSTMTLDNPRGAERDDAEVRTLRFGLDVRLERGGSLLRLLVVHLKSGCAERAIPSVPIPVPAIASQLPEDACEVVSRQVPELKAWIDGATRAGGPPFIVAGDFNRRFTQEIKQRPALRPAEQYWPRLLGRRTPALGDDVMLALFPREAGDLCFVWDDPAYADPIDYFVYGGGAVPATATVRKIRFQDITNAAGQPLAPADANGPGVPKRPGEDATTAVKDAFFQAIAPWTDRLSDHCPRKLSVP